MDYKVTQSSLLQKEVKQKIHLPPLPKPVGEQRNYVVRLSPDSPVESICFYGLVAHKTVMPKAAGLLSMQGKHFNERFLVRRLYPNQVEFILKNADKKLYRVPTGIEDLDKKKILKDVSLIEFLQIIPAEEFAESIAPKLGV